MGYAQTYLGGGITGYSRSSLDYFNTITSEATAVYTLREGSATRVRVRRSSDDEEQDFTGNQILQSAGTSGSLLNFCGAGDGFVVRWYDSAGSNNATQTTASTQPQIVSSGSVITENGKPAMTVTSKEMDVPESLVSFGDSFSSFCVFNNTASTEGTLYNLTDSSFAISVSFNRTAGEVHFRVLKSSDTSTSGSYTSGTQYLLSSFDKATDQLFLNNTELNNANAGRASTFESTLFRSATREFEGNVQELIFYDSDQSSNRTAIEENIANYWGITLA